VRHRPLTWEERRHGHHRLDRPLAQVLFNRDTVDEFFDISTWLTAIIGAIILLLIYRLVTGRGRRRAL
jgi:hypothetical protein